MVTRATLHTLFLTAVCAAAGLISAQGQNPDSKTAMTETVRLGQRHFMYHCHRCHPQGEVGYGPSLIGHAHSAEEIRQQVRNGHGMMPAFSKDRISEAELDAIIAFILYLHENKEGRESGHE